MKYPLEAARTLRAQALATAESGLLRARRDEQAAESSMKRATEALEAHEALLRRSREEARTTGVTPGAALVREQAYEARLRTERAALAEKKRTAGEDELAARSATAAAKDVLAAARAEQEAVERHHEAWRAEQRKLGERRSEADADDLISAAFGRGED